MSNAAEQQYAEQGIVYLDPKMRIKNYWTQRSHSFAELRVRELNSVMADRWLREIAKHIPAGGQLRILDIGTGPGFFSIILAEAGYQVTAVDYTEAMLEEAKKNAGALARRITYCQMDASHLAFADETFDAVVSRNLTWNLEDPEQAYKEWMRVLKKGGILLNYDANWYHHLFDAEKREEYEKDRQMVTEAGLEDHYTCTDIDTMEEIARQVPLSRIDRPRWDQKILQELGTARVSVDTEVWKQVWSDVEKVNYHSTPMFGIEAVKE